ncbi:hypothetical protein IQ254_24655 [Nodosilinea sp. LEGE 07088]|uniref:hypothetical protein n=1 Tax=Nodosilinea sp. LEGE 07088 TaxID=2777968 RepID=UPI00188144AB|nr:hypothetical protein [Nodosilinea sp. LEGE 07088]MBE9140351.1 hypothetical protein [Nodosilinea sp. LEGE 07088]
MASSPQLVTQPESLSWRHRIQTSLGRLATATAAVVGLAAMAGQGAIGSTPVLANGTYLYGESPVTNTIGAVYLVFEATNGQLNGAVYQPSSSFDCVRGTVGGSALNLVVTNAYDQTETLYSVALAGDTAVASVGGGGTSIQLDGMHAIATLSELDHQLLAICGDR